MNKKREAPCVAGTNNRASTVYKHILTRRRLLNKCRCAILRGSFFMALVALICSAMTEDLKVALVLAIPSAVWAVIFVIVNSSDVIFWSIE